MVFIPDALLTDDVPDTNGIGFRLDRDRSAKSTEQALGGRTAGRSPAPCSCPACRPPCWTARSSWSHPSISTRWTTSPAPSRTRTASAAACSAPRRPRPGDEEGSRPTRGPNDSHATRPPSGDPYPCRGGRPPSWSARTANPSATSGPAAANPTPGRPPAPRRSDAGGLAPLPARRRGTALPAAWTPRPYGGPDRVPGRGRGDDA
ncbi:hypothetical protein LT493_30560 [Streptomyces tricolor]|nr:hypothetical protein [Streptomyces tricolor]